MTANRSSATGLPTVTPYFTVQDADRFINFLCAAFAATLIKENRYGDNKVQHARLLIGDTVIILNQSTQDYPANVSQMHIYVDDADSTDHSALTLGATSLMPPNERPHGDRMAGIKDPCGNVWWIATRQT